MLDIKLTILSTTISMIIMILLYLYTYIIDPKKYTLIWLISWIFYLLRLISKSLSISLSNYSDIFSITSSIFLIISAYFLYKGSNTFLKQKTKKYIPIVSLLLFIWTLLPNIINTYLNTDIPIFIFSGLIYIMIGLKFIKYLNKEYKINKFIGVLFILWGIHTIHFPFLIIHKNMVIIVIFLSALLGTLSSLSLLILNLQKALSENWKNHEKFRSIFNNAPVGIAVTDNLGDIVLYNDAFYKIIGLFQENQKIDIKDISLKDRLEDDLLFIKSIKEKKVSSFSTEKKYVKPNGDPIWSYITVGPIYDNRDEEIEHYIGVVEDITYRKNIELKLIENEKKLKKAQKLANIGYWILYLNDLKIDLSKQITEILEISKDSIDDFNQFREYIHPKDRVKIDNMISSIKRGIIGTQKIDFRFILENNKIKNIINYYEYNYDKNGNPISIFGILKDITNDFNIKKSLKKSKELAEKASKAKTDFLANMSHEIRTPLNGIIGIVELLKMTSLTNEQIEYVDIIERSGNILLNLINDIIDISKIESGKIDIEYKIFNPKNIVLNIIDSFIMVADKKGIKLEFISPNRNIGKVVGDQEKISQVLINLISNGIKFTNKGKVEVKVNIENIDINVAKLKFIVKDTGIGINDDIKDIIFEPFQQGDQYTKRYQGAGLGLGISKRLLSSIGSEIKFNTSPYGSTFWFDIDFFRYPSFTQNRSKVIIFDNDNIEKRILETIFLSLDIELIVVNTFEYGFNILKENSDISTFIFNVDLENFKLKNYIEKNIKKIKFKKFYIFLSISHNRSFKDKIYNNYILHYISPPINKEILMKKLF